MALLIFIKKQRPSAAPRAGKQLDLAPAVRFGLDLTCPLAAETEAPPSPAAAAPAYGTVEVWNGEEALTMSLFDYIVGVTAGEMPASYEEEALKAQAVAARTFTLKHMTGEARCKSGHTICTDPSCCQAYISVEQMKKNWGSSFSAYYEKIARAVSETEGMVLTSGGELVTALYHSSSGGRTENCEAVFALALPYLVSVESEGEEDSPEYSAVKTYTSEEFAAIINERFPDAQLRDPAKEVVVWERTESGRITLIRLGGVVITGQQLRNALRLHSTNARFDFEDGMVRITCLGYGHGVGMSQCGANAMARRGAGFEEILKHYYTGVELSDMRDMHF